MDPRIADLLVLYGEQVAPAMRSLPFFNPVLQTEAIEFRERSGRLSGILITPWFMNLILFAGEDDAWADLPSGRTVEIRFPSGRQTCLLSAPGGAELHLSLPLFTTMQHFDSHETARRIAVEVLHSIYEPAKPDTAHEGNKFSKLSRRALLFGSGQNTDA